MKLLTKTKLGLGVLLYVARATADGGVAPGREIAAHEGLNEPYLEQIMVHLKRAGLVRSVRGRNGGYALARPPTEITLLQVIESFEGQLDLTGKPDRQRRPAAFASGPADEVWSELAAAIRERATNTTLAHILERDQRCPEYHI